MSNDNNSNQPAFAAVTGFGGGVSVGIYADTYEDLKDRFRDVFGPGDGTDVLDGLMAKLQVESNRALAELAQGTAASLGGQAPAAAAPAAAPASSAPNPNGPPPGQFHDPKDPTKTKWVPPGFSKKTQRNYDGFWTKP